MKKRGIRYLNNKNAQVWVETVIYTLIGLTIIGLLLAVSQPELERRKDKALIEQAINGMGLIDEKVYDVLSGTGNKRRIELKLGKGQFIFDAANDKLVWEIDSNYQYSELGTPVSAGRMQVTTVAGSPYTVILESNYAMDLRFDNADVEKEIGPASTPHVITVENLGIQNGKTVINFNII